MRELTSLARWPLAEEGDTFAVSPSSPADREPPSMRLIIIVARAGSASCALSWASSLASSSIVQG